METPPFLSEVVVEEMREWQKPLSRDKIEWLQTKYAELLARRPALGLPRDEYWDA